VLLASSVAVDQPNRRNNAAMRYSGSASTHLLRHDIQALTDLSTDLLSSKVSTEISGHSLHARRIERYSVDY